MPGMLGITLKRTSRPLSSSRGRAALRTLTPSTSSLHRRLQLEHSTGPCPGVPRVTRVSGPGLTEIQNSLKNHQSTSPNCPRFPDALERQRSTSKNVYTTLPNETNVYNLLLHKTNVYSTFPHKTDVYNTPPHKTDAYNTLPHDVALLKREYHSTPQWFHQGTPEAYPPGIGEEIGPGLEGREEMEYDVVIVGAGPAGLSAAIRLKQLQPDCSVCVIEKGAQAGSHILSGNVFEPRALSELFPDWMERGAPLRVPVTKDKFLFLASSKHSIPLPPPSGNHGNYVISLSEFVRWLAAEAEQLGVEVYPGIAGAKLLLQESDTCQLAMSSTDFGALGAERRRVVGIVTGDVGRGKDGIPKETFQPGMVLRAKTTFLAEGCRGSLSQEAIHRFGLVSKGRAQHQTYALGLKEVWEVEEGKHHPGEVLHTIGYPLDMGTYGGGFLYHMENRMIALGLVIALDNANPHLNNFQEFQRWKTHPVIRKLLEGATVVQYGARALNEGGIQSVPGLVFPGGALIGCSAGFLNVPKIKGTHTAMKSGMLAAEALFGAHQKQSTSTFFVKKDYSESGEKGQQGAMEREGSAVAQHGSEAKEECAGLEPSLVDGQNAGSESSLADVDKALSAYPGALKSSWVWDELYRVRNIRPGFQWGLVPGLLNAAFELFVSGGRSPWTLKHGAPDHLKLQPLSKWKGPKVAYPKPDGSVSFDILTSVFRSSTNHDHDEPCHLRLLDSGVPERLNLPVFGGPETKYCPAGVYEYVKDEEGVQKLQINAQNCVHCKACDIKDPSQNIRWTTPEGGDGPGYTVM